MSNAERGTYLDKSSLANLICKRVGFDNYLVLRGMERKG